VQIHIFSDKSPLSDDIQGIKASNCSLLWKREKSCNEDALLDIPADNFTRSVTIKLTKITVGLYPLTN
jgi:hypothetical protein